MAPKKNTKSKRYSCYLCAGIDNNLMIQCDECDDKYHLKCLNIDGLDKNDDWICVECLQKDISRPPKAPANLSKQDGSKIGAIGDKSSGHVSHRSEVKDNRNTGGQNNQSRFSQHSERISQSTRSSVRRRTHLELERLEEERSLQEKRDKEYLNSKYRILMDERSDRTERTESERRSTDRSSYTRDWLQKQSIEAQPPSLSRNPKMELTLEGLKSRFERKIDETRFDNTSPPERNQRPLLRAYETNQEKDTIVTKPKPTSLGVQNDRFQSMPDDIGRLNTRSDPRWGQIPCQKHDARKFMVQERGSTKPDGISGAPCSNSTFAMQPPPNNYRPSDQGKGQRLRNISPGSANHYTLEWDNYVGTIYDKGKNPKSQPTTSKMMKHSTSAPKAHPCPEADANEQMVRGHELRKSQESWQQQEQHVDTSKTKAVSTESYKPRMASKRHLSPAQDARPHKFRGNEFKRAPECQARVEDLRQKDQRSAVATASPITSLAIRGIGVKSTLRGYERSKATWENSDKIKSSKREMNSMEFAGHQSNLKERDHNDETVHVFNDDESQSAFKSHQPNFEGRNYNDDTNYDTKLKLNDRPTNDQNHRKVKFDEARKFNQEMSRRPSVGNQSKTSSASIALENEGITESQTSLTSIVQTDLQSTTGKSPRTTQTKNIKHFVFVILRTSINWRVTLHQSIRNGSTKLNEIIKYDVESDRPKNENQRQGREFGKTANQWPRYEAPVYTIYVQKMRFNIGREYIIEQQGYREAYRRRIFERFVRYGLEILKISCRISKVKSQITASPDVPIGFYKSKLATYKRLLSKEDEKQRYDGWRKRFHIFEIYQNDHRIANKVYRRKEFQASVFRTRLSTINKNVQRFKIRRRITWTKSALDTVVSWLNSDQQVRRAKLEIIVGTQSKLAGQITKEIKSGSWGPSDKLALFDVVRQEKGLAHRESIRETGGSARTTDNNGRWFSGPECLCLSGNQWSKRKPIKSDIEEEMKAHHSHLNLVLPQIVNRMNQNVPTSKFGNIEKNDHHQQTIFVKHLDFKGGSNSSKLWSKFAKEYLAKLVRRIHLLAMLPKSISWILTKDNVADEATKWTKISNFDPSNRWFRGPEFLRQSEDKWPEKKPISTDVEEEMKANYLHSSLIIPRIIDPERFSNYKRMVRSLAYAIRFINLFTGKAKKGEPLKQEELRKAENLIFRQAQFEGYPTEMVTLERNNVLPVMKRKFIEQPSPLYDGTPYIDADGILRMKRRIDGARDLSMDTKRPIVLPKDSRITKLLLLEYHSNCFHQSHETVVNEVRQKFYIPRLREVLKKSRKDCQMCKIKKAHPSPPQMADLPTARLATRFVPYSFTGIDFFGPMFVTVGRRKEKRWGVLFTCLTIRAIHIEIAPGLDTNSCILCIQNFVADHGPVIEFHSDCGTNFKGSDKVLQEEISKIDPERLQTEFTTTYTKWVFNPPASPHMGGSWERLIRTVKSAINEVMPTRTPKEDMLRNLLKQIQNVVNSRPLIYIPLDVEEDEALTPNHFIKLSSNGLKPPCKIELDGPYLRESWKESQRLTEFFWKRFIDEYLPSIARRTKWHKPMEPLKPGDLVLVVDPNNPRSTYPKAKVLETEMGSNGQVRRAKVEVISSTRTNSEGKICKVTKLGLWRSAHKLALLDVAKKEGLADGNRETGGSVAATKFKSNAGAKEERVSRVISAGLSEEPTSA